MLAEYPDTGCCIAGRTGRENRIERLVLCLAGCWWAVERWNWPEWLFLPAVLLGLAAGAQNFWVFCKERLDRSKKEKNHRVGFNSHQ